MKKIGIKAIVSGTVQGVGFRQATREKAQALNLTGWVRNVNHDVELLAYGDEHNVTSLTQWLYEGPVHAKVSSVQWKASNDTPDKTFTIKY